MKERIRDKSTRKKDGIEECKRVKKGEGRTLGNIEVGVAQAAELCGAVAGSFCPTRVIVASHHEKSRVRTK